MTCAELRSIIRERAMARARDTVVLAWRTAYYGRVKHMPDLAGELEAFEGSRGGDVDDDGSLSPERHAMIKDRMRFALSAWNAKLSAEGAAGG